MSHTDNKQWDFIGYSSDTGKVLPYYDTDIIKRDFMNQFNTRKGERVMDTDFGFIGWDLLFESNTNEVENLLEADVRRIIVSDPRIQLEEIIISKIDHGYNVRVFLIFPGQFQAEELSIIFDENSRRIRL